MQRLWVKIRPIWPHQCVYLCVYAHLLEQFFVPQRAIHRPCQHRLEIDLSNHSIVKCDAQCVWAGDFTSNHPVDRMSHLAHPFSAAVLSCTLPVLLATAPNFLSVCPGAIPPMLPQVVVLDAATHHVSALLGQCCIPQHGSGSTRGSAEHDGVHLAPRILRMIIPKKRASSGKISLHNRNYCTLKFTPRNIMIRLTMPWNRLLPGNHPPNHYNPASARNELQKPTITSPLHCVMLYAILGMWSKIIRFSVVYIVISEVIKTFAGRAWSNRL